MANPQAENGHIRISNELWDELLRRDFSKRQMNMILLIWRLSYGCQRKDCRIEKYNDFELAGLYKGDIKKELKYLKTCKVIFWNEEEMIFSINKDYEKWQMSPSKKFDSEKLDRLISENLKDKKVSKTLTSDEEKVSEILTGLSEKVGEIPTKKVSETLTIEPKRVSNSLTNEGPKVSKILTDEKDEVSKTLTDEGEKVSKTLTQELVKHLPGQPSIPTAPSDSGALKTVLKTLKDKDIKDIKTSSTPLSNTVIDINYKKITDALIEKKVVPFTGLNSQIGEDWDYILQQNWFDDPLEMVLHAIAETARENRTSWRWVYNKLGFWKRDGFRKVDDVQAFLKTYEDRKNFRTGTVKKSLYAQGEESKRRQAEPFKPIAGASGGISDDELPF